MNAENKIYLTAKEDYSWSAKIVGEKPSAEAVELCSEQTYPVHVFYDRTDINGSSNLERDICKDRESLVSSLNWIGKCGYPLLEIWDFNIDKQISNELSQLFLNSYKARAEKMAQAANEMYESSKDSLDAKIQHAESKATEYSTAFSAKGPVR